MWSESLRRSELLSDITPIGVVSENLVGASARRVCKQRPVHIEVVSVHVVSGGVPAAVGGKVLGRGGAEGLHEGSKATDQGFYGFDLMAAPGAHRSQPGFERKVRYVLVRGDPFVGDEPCHSEYRVLCHHRQQATVDRGLARAGDGFKGPMARAIRCCEKLLLQGLPAPHRRCRRAVPALIGQPPQPRGRRVVCRAPPLTAQLARSLSALALVGFDDARKAVVSLRLQRPDDRHAPAPDALTRRLQHLGPAAAGHRLRCFDHVTRQCGHQIGAMDTGHRRPATAPPRRPAPEQFHRCAPVLVQPHRIRASPPQRFWAVGIDPRVDLQDGLGTACTPRQQVPRSCAVTVGSGGRAAAELVRSEAGHGGSPLASDTSAYLIDTKKQS